MKLPLLLLLLAGNVFACEKGCSPYQITPNQTVCACDEATQTGDPIKPSDEKPAKNATPAYEREGLQVDMSRPQDTAAEDAAKQKWLANYQGKDPSWVKK